MLELPTVVSLLLVWVIGVLIARGVTLSVHLFSYHEDSLPWPKSVTGILKLIKPFPVLGWFGLKRQSERTRDWFGPLVVELLLPIGFALLYYWEIEYRAFADPRQVGVAFGAEEKASLLIRFGIHVVFLTVLITASYEDILEKAIRDLIQTPLAIFGLASAVLFEETFLPLFPEARTAEELSSIPHLHSWYPNPPITGMPNVLSMIGMFAFYCSVVVVFFPPLRKWRRLGFRLTAYSIYRQVVSRCLLQLCSIVISGALVFALACYMGGDSWLRLHTALLGLTTGILLGWGVRLAAGIAMGQEAFGFGDVILLGNLCLFLGFQNFSFILLASPFLGLGIVYLNYLRTDETEIWFGPFLAASGASLLFAWMPYHQELLPYTALLGEFQGLLIAGCLVFLWTTLSIYMQLKKRFLLKYES